MESLAQSFRLLTPTLVRAAHGHLPPNRRDEMRRAVRIPCQVRKRNGALVSDRTLDLSPGGALVSIDARLDPGLELFVRFQTTELPLWFETEATVARYIPGRRRGDRGRAVGLRFSSLAAVSRLILRGHLVRSPLVEPQREPPPELSPACLPRRPSDLDLSWFALVAGIGA